MSIQYLTGYDGRVSLTPAGGSVINIKVTKWDFKPKVEVARTRAGGDGAYSRDPIAKDWEANIEGLVQKGVAAPNSALVIGLNTTAFVLKSDGGVTPKLQVSGVGIVTEGEYGSPADDHITISFKIECDDADVTNFPTVTVNA